MLHGIICVFVGLGIIFYIYMTWHFDYWKKRHIPSPAPRFLLGNLPGAVIQKRHMSYDIDDIYKEYKSQHGFVGIINMRQPHILVIDPLLVKQVLISEFHSFADNSFAHFTDKKTDPIFGRNPFILKGKEWEEKRAEITPAFTTSRIQTMNPVIEHVCKRMTKYLQYKIQQRPDGFEAKELAAKYTTDVMSSCVFGLDGGSFTGGKAIIREMGKILFTPNWRIFAYFVVAQVFPYLPKVYKLAFVPKVVEQFFVEIMKDAVAFRRQTNVDRFDYLHYLLELQEKKNLNDLDMVAHAITFFIDGFETSSVAISYTLYQLGRNKRVQDKLRKEIRDTLAKHSELSYDVVAEMPYLNQIFIEALRLHPPFSVFCKTCTETSEFRLSPGEFRRVDKGMQILIPTYSLHRDPEYYDQPDKFMPERFNPEHGGVKAYRDKGVFFPFGDGPRICLGEKFAMAQVKAAIVAIVKSFEISVNAKTKTPLALDAKQYISYPIGGLWLDFKTL
ncbi:probable cytochrome P450 28d1 [Phlebotomus argentipes]|uniref:probable cytochrome P450 28d1 n=1 Tax=Phlebotomus argentipes TaxID=94469 RepID=UPI0028934887|nr:probable cytochrome P450 28d1 [Phlebotomus argentipes]